jgi:hypothetical protein
MTSLQSFAVFIIPSRTYQNSDLNYAMTVSFHILSSLLFASQAIISRFIILGIEVVVKRIKNKHIILSC